MCQAGLTNAYSYRDVLLCAKRSSQTADSTRDMFLVCQAWLARGSFQLRHVCFRVQLDSPNAGSYQDTLCASNFVKLQIAMETHFFVCVPLGSLSVGFNLRTQRYLELGIYHNRFEFVIALAALQELKQMCTWINNNDSIKHI